MPSTVPREEAGIGWKDEMKTLIVTSALIMKGRKVLLAQRREEDDQGLLWEFPGGKVEDGEDPRQALKRELREELGIEGEAGALFDGSYAFYPMHPILLLVYDCRIRDGVPKPLGCQDLRWVGFNELGRLAMPPADEPIRSHLLSCRGWKK